MIITSGLYKGRKINAPDEKITRPTLSKVRMGVFNTLFSILGNFSDKAFLDLFGGSGIMGLEAISRGFKEVTVCEINKKSASIIVKNYKLLGLKPNIILGDSRKIIEKLGNNFDVIYVDPPYESDLYDNIVSKIKSGIVVLEHTKKFDYPGWETIREKNYGGKIITIMRKKI